MNKFDFLQFNIPLEAIINPNFDILGVTTDLDSKKYSLKQGRSLISEHDFRIVFNLTKQSATIGFSAKILGSDYYKLISQNNINDCFKLISDKYGLCHSIDTEMALRWGSCNKLEVTKDIQLQLDTEQYQSLNNLIVDTHKWKLLGKRGFVHKNGFGAMKMDNSESIILYGKEQEMAQDKNRKYVNEYNLGDKFRGLTRVEMKLNSRKAIKKRFNTNDLIPVLESTETPIVDLLSELFENAQSSSIVRGNFIKGQRDRERLAYAKEFDYNMGLLSDDLRRRLGRNWKRDLKPIIEVLESENHDLQNTIELVESIKKSLTDN